MKNKYFENYAIGLNIGTSSVGWSVIDEQSKLLKKGNKPLWGYTLFDSADNAVNRKLARGTRRRYRRRKQRIKLLQYLMQPIIKEIDKDFYNKLEKSYQTKNDRNNAGQYILFDQEFKDKQYYKEYPTIYHLRHELMTTKEKVDARLLYLAFHHIVKYRGNFLYENKKFNANDLSIINENLNYIFKQEYGKDATKIDSIDIHNYSKVIYNDVISKRVKQEKVKNLSKDREVKAIIDEITKAILGYKFNVNKLFDIDSEYKSISFNDMDIEEKLGELEILLQNQIIFDQLKQLYEYGLLKDILANSEDMTISASMINTYKIHKKDLKRLKDIVVNKRIYKLIFSKDGLYDTYINKPRKCSQAIFYKELKKHISGLEGAKSILTDIENLQFLPKINKSDNGAIPYQLHLNEMIAIIDNQSSFYPFLNEIKDKLLNLVSFRIPYYIGPLDVNATNSWLVLHENNKIIRPWNINEVVDMEKTATAFINRMRGNCAYLQGQAALPINSLVLARFNLYNELNKIRINGEFINYALKEKIINQLFLKKSEVTVNELSKWLIENHEMHHPIDIKGTQKEDRFAASLKNEIIFRNIFGSDYNARFDDIEKIIEYVSIYKEEVLIVNTLKKEMPYLSDGQLDVIKKLNFKGYGHLSAKFINGLMSSSNSICYGTIIEILDKTNLNMMQIINDTNFGFQLAIEDFNSNFFVGDIQSQINELSGSPELKKGIWQATKIVQDIVKYMKCNPRNIYIEFTKEKVTKRRTQSRYNQLEKIYKEKLNNSKVYKQLNENRNSLNSDRLYLYFIQQGRCMYSGQHLDIDLLNTYQVEHILPQSYTKDNSLDNVALVIGNQIRRKANSLLLDDEIIRKQYGFWKNLYDIKLIGAKKFKNLTRTNVKDKEQESLIARQLMETRQIALHVRSLLNNIYSNTKVIIVNSDLSNEVRRKFELAKITELNHCHHANDAYLVCLIGQFISNKYPSFYLDNKINIKLIKDEITNRLSDEKNAIQTIYSFIVNQMSNKILVNEENGVIYWEGDKQIEYIKKIFDYKTYFMNYIGKYNDGELYNSTIYSPKDLGLLDNKKGYFIPTKNNRPVDKYGGYKSINKASGLIVEYENKGKLTKKMVSKPIVGINNNEKLDDYIRKELNISNYKIVREIKLGQMFEYNNTLYSMTSPEEWLIIEPLYLSCQSRKIISKAKIRSDSVESEELNNVYEEIIEKINANIESQQGRLDNSVQDFIKINNEEKIKVILDVLNGISSKVTKDINFGESKYSRYGRVSRKNININDSVFIFSSPSGIFTTRCRI